MSRERTAHLVHTGESRYVGTTGTGRHVVYGDAAAAGELSPVEMIVVSLAGCSAMDVWAILVKKRQAVERFEIGVVGLQRDEYPQVLTELTVTHEVWGPNVAEAAVRRAIELSATKYCPVNAMVSAGATQVHHRYRVHDTASGATAEGLVITTGPYRRPDVVT